MDIAHIIITYIVLIYFVWAVTVGSLVSVSNWWTKEEDHPQLIQPASSLLSWRTKDQNSLHRAFYSSSRFLQSTETCISRGAESLIFNGWEHRQQHQRSDERSKHLWTDRQEQKLHKILFVWLSSYSKPIYQMCILLMCQGKSLMPFKKIFFIFILQNQSQFKLKERPFFDTSQMWIAPPIVGSIFYGHLGNGIPDLPFVCAQIIVM